MDDLPDLEKQGWNTLTLGKDEAQNFYSSVLREDAVMVFPGGMKITGKDQILELFSSQPWSSFQMNEANVIPISDDVKMVIYRVIAKRPDSDPYHAIISSTYVHIDDSWKMVHHQQSKE